MLVKTFGGAVHGVDATLITIEVSVSKGKDFYLVGLPDKAVQEAKIRIDTAVKNTNFYSPKKKTVVMSVKQTLAKIEKTANLKVVGIKRI